MNVSIFYINSVKVQIAFFRGLREYLGSGAKKTALQQATYQTTYLCWSRNSSHFLHLLAQQICLPIFLSHAPLSPLCSHARDRPPARATPVSITDHLPPIRRAQDHLRGALMRPPALPPPASGGPPSARCAGHSPCLRWSLALLPGNSQRGGQIFPSAALLPGSSNGDLLHRICSALLLR
jgi:hypothetical protein